MAITKKLLLHKCADPLNFPVNLPVDKCFALNLLTHMPKEIFTLVLHAIFNGDDQSVKLFMSTPICFALLFLSERSNIAKFTDVPIHRLYIEPKLNLEKIYNVVYKPIIKNSDYEYLKSISDTIDIPPEKRITLDMWPVIYIMCTAIIQAGCLAITSVWIAFYDNSFPTYVRYPLCLGIFSLAIFSFILYYDLTTDCDVETYLHRKKFDLYFYIK